MSRNHRGPTAAFLKRMRPIIKAQLPLPCVNPRPGCPGIVEHVDAWDVAHVIALDNGGGNTPDNVGAAHAGCNRADGGRRGARHTNRLRQLEARRREW